MDASAMVVCAGGSAVLRSVFFGVESCRPAEGGIPLHRGTRKNCCQEGHSHPRAVPRRADRSVHSPCSVARSLSPAENRVGENSSAGGRLCRHSRGIYENRGSDCPIHKGGLGQRKILG